MKNLKSKFAAALILMSVTQSCKNKSNDNVVNEERSAPTTVQAPSKKGPLLSFVNGPEFSMKVTRDWGGETVKETIAVDVDGKAAYFDGQYIETEGYYAQANPENYDSEQARKILETMSARERKKVVAARTSKSMAQSDIDWIKSHMKFAHGRTAEEINALGVLFKLYTKEQTELSEAEVLEAKRLIKAVEYAPYVDSRPQ